MTTNAAVVFRALFLFYGLTEQLRENIEDFSCNSYAWNFFEKWLTKLSYEIKVKIKEVLTCSVVVLRYTVLKMKLNIAPFRSLFKKFGFSLC